MSEQSRSTTALMIIETLITASIFITYTCLGDGSSKSIAKDHQEMFDVPVFHLKAHEIKESRQNYYPLTYLPSAKTKDIDQHVKDFLEIYQKANLYAFSDPTSEPALGKSLEEGLVIGSDNILEILEDFKSYVHVGDPIYQRCSAAIDLIVSNIARGNYQLNEGNLDAKTLTSKPLKDYREACGNALPILVKYGLISDRGWTKPESSDIFDALQRRRFVDTIARRISPVESLSPADRWLIAWWKVGLPQAFTLEERENHLNEMLPMLEPLNDPSSPFFFDSVRFSAALTFQSKGPQAAKEIYKANCQTPHYFKNKKSICSLLTP